MKDLNKFKKSLFPYLQSKGIDIKKNPIFCINPDHSNTKTEAMIIYDDGFKCMGSCGITGDIYDAAGLFIGSKDLNEQYAEVERTLTGFNEAEIKAIKKPAFKADPKSIKEFENLILNHGGREKGVTAFLKQRGYKEPLIQKMKGYYGYWCGINEAKKIVDELTLFKAGIPEKAWYKSGVVCKLATGYKLMWYGTDREGKNFSCQKRNSTAAKTFPAPYTTNELTGTIHITEAETSAISMRASGFKQVYSSGSVNGITKYNVNLLSKVQNIIFVYDGDSAGRYYSGLDEYLIDKKTGDKKQPKSIPKKIFDSGYTGQIHAVRLQEDSDADDFIRAGKVTELQELIKNAVEIEAEKSTPPPDVKDEESEDTEIIAPFQFLGFDDRNYYVLPKNQQIPIRIGRGENVIKNWLFEIASKKWWLNEFSSKKEEGDDIKTSFNRSDAIDWLRTESYKVGIFDDNRIKGVGVHIDNGSIVLNTGRNLKIGNNKFINYEEWKGDNFYIRSKKTFEIKNKAWTTKEGVNLWNQLNTFKFEKKIDYIAVAGYLTLAPFSGVLFRRPAIWLTAAPGTGKTFLIEEIIGPAVGGDKFPLITEGLSSEAYIRQNLKKDAIPVIIDEFEAHNKLEKMLIKSVIKLNRSSYGDKKSGKGSTGHDPVDFNLKSMFCFGSVSTTLDNEADRSRIHVCRMKASTGICKAPSDYDGLRSRIFKSLKKILDDIEEIKLIITGIGLSNRMADTYSPLIAGAWNMISDEKIGAGKNPEFIKYFEEAIYELKTEDQIKDEDRIIERILQQRIRIDSQQELTIAEMLTFRRKDITDENDLNYDIVRKDDSILHDDRIQRYGIRRYYSKEKFKKEVIAFAINSPDIAKILENTPFSEYKEVLQRNEAVIEKSFNTRIAGVPSKSIIFDWKEFEKKYLKAD